MYIGRHQSLRQREKYLPCR